LEELGVTANTNRSNSNSRSNSPRSAGRPRGTSPYAASKSPNRNVQNKSTAKTNQTKTHRGKYNV
jgi:hypothetical protein